MMKKVMTSLALLLVMAAGSPPGVQAAEGDESTPAKAVEERDLWRLVFDNDGFVRKGNTSGESPHPGLDYDAVSRGAVFGLHVASRRFSVHFNFYSFNELPFESVIPLTDLSWGNITIEYRF